MASSTPLKWGSLVVALAGVAIPVMLRAKKREVSVGRRQRGAIGLQNPGNLCFFNSLMQGLAGVQAFSSFLEGMSRELEQNPSKDSFSGELHRLLGTLRVSQKDILEPWPLIRRMQRDMERELDFGDQQDVEELWNLIMEILDREANDLQIDDEHRMSLASAGSEDAKSNTSVRSEDVIENPFMGFMGDSLQCSMCKNCRPMKLSRFFHISVDIPAIKFKASVEDCISSWLVHEPVDDVECLSCSAREMMQSLNEEESLLQNIIEANGSSPALQANLKHVLQAKEALDRALANNDSAMVEELVGADSGFRLCRRTKYKQMLLVRSPHALCLHVKRRKFNPSSGKFYKDERSVEVSPTLALQNVNFDQNVALPRPKAVYKLLSVIVHHGGPNSGHFTTFRKDPGDESTWHHFSDEHVRLASFTEIANCSPYMLFYQKTEVSR